jgi:Rieske Fe-S protein
MNRREFLRGVIVTSVLVASSVAGLVEIANVAKSAQQTVGRTTTSTTTQTQQNSSASGSITQATIAAPSGYNFITALSALAGKSYAYFNHPTEGSSIFVNYNGQWKAFSSTCTHRPCIVNYQATEIYCPCHGGTFNPNDGSVNGGPPPSPLPEYGVQVVSGNVYVSLNRIN